MSHGNLTAGPVAVQAAVGGSIQNQRSDRSDLKTVWLRYEFTQKSPGSIHASNNLLKPLVLLARVGVIIVLSQGDEEGSGKLSCIPGAYIK